MFFVEYLCVGGWVDGIAQHDLDVTIETHDRLEFRLDPIRL